MIEFYRPEGGYIETAANREALASLSGLERAMQEGRVIEGRATLCDEHMRLHVDLGCAQGIIEPEEAVWCRAGEERKDIAVISRVGKPVACKILGIDLKNGTPCVRLSRRLAQKECIEAYVSGLCEGDILQARVTHMEPFGAFLDVGCGVVSLLSVDCISVSRISHPRDRLRVGESLPVAVKCIQRDTQRIYVTLRELLGTWEENASFFEAGQTVTGVLRSVESYGVFVELAPNLAGLAEVRPEVAEELRGRIGHNVAVYIKSIVPERMKIKLVLINADGAASSAVPLRLFVDPAATPHLDRWRYSPAECRRIVETCFGGRGVGEEPF
ncbi:MAG: 30S ribosomal protein S1 [Clostridia bacterium]|nr:30S ribosomal protein S1 [Clostridia bacterium]